MIFSELRQLAYWFLGHIHGHGGEVIASTLGAIAGSFSAYWLQRANENRREKQQKCDAIIRAQVALVSQLNTLSILWLNHLAPLEHVQGRESILRPILTVDFELLVDVDSLVFLVTRKTPAITQTIHLAQLGYKSARDTIRSRNQAISDLADTHQAKEVNAEGVATFHNADPRRIYEIKAATDAIYRSVPNAITRCKAAVEELRKIGSERYSNWFTRRFSPRFLKVTDVKYPPVDSST